MGEEIETSLKVDRLADELIKNLGKDVDEILINSLGAIAEISRGAMMRARDILRKK